MNVNKQQVLRQFDRRARQYDSYAGMQREIVDCLIAMMSDEPINALLDLGCGTGYALSKLKSQRINTLTGLDLAPSMLAVAKQVVPEASFVQADMERLPFIEKSANAVFSSSSVQWCDLSVAVLEMARVLEPQGCLYLSSFLTGTLLQWRLWWMDESTRFEQSFLTIDEFVAGVEQAGFTVELLQQQRFDQQFESFDAALNSIRQLGAGNAALSRAQSLAGRRRYRQAKDSALACLQKNGYINLPYEVVMIKATLSN